MVDTQSWTQALWDTPPPPTGVSGLLRLKPLSSTLQLVSSTKPFALIWHTILVLLWLYGYWFCTSVLRYCTYSLYWLQFYTLVFNAPTSNSTAHFLYIQNYYCIYFMSLQSFQFFPACLRWPAPLLARGNGALLLFSPDTGYRYWLYFKSLCVFIWPKSFLYPLFLNRITSEMLGTFLILSPSLEASLT